MGIEVNATVTSDENDALRAQLDRKMKNLVAHSDAMDTLTSRREAPTASRWWYLFLVAIGSALGWLLHFATPNQSLVLCLFAGIGFVVAINAYIECIKLRKRLDATIVLLRETQSASKKL